MPHRGAPRRLTPLALALSTLLSPLAAANDRAEPTDLPTVMVRSASGFEQAIADAARDLPDQVADLPPPPPRPASRW